MTLKKFIKHSLKILLLILFVGYYSSITMFYHSHIVKGNVLSHSHPYSKKPSESHSHSSTTYKYIHQLNEICWEDISVDVVIPNPTIQHHESQLVYISPPINTSNFCLSQLRAPPVNC